MQSKILNDVGRQLALGESISEYVDSRSNRWWLDSTTNVVHLKLAAEERTRRIGSVVNDKFVVNRNREKHLYEKTASYGFSSEIIRELGVKYIDLHEDEGMFRIPVSLLVEKGEHLFFKKQGYEKQLFLSISEILPYKTVPEMDIKRISLMGESWYNRLKPEFEKDYMKALAIKVASRRLEAFVYPDKEDVFKAFKLCPFEETKVIIIGQDVYHTPNTADGLAFSCKNPNYMPPSLNMIYNAIEKDVYEGLLLDKDPSLVHWAEQGVLLLNTILTVDKNNPKSHEGYGWQIFIQAALKQLQDFKKNYVVLLWGRDAQLFREYIENGTSLILEAEHPAYAARQQREWENHDCFNKVNKYLISKGLSAIKW